MNFNFRRSISLGFILLLVYFFISFFFQISKLTKRLFDIKGSYQTYYIDEPVEVPFYFYDQQLSDVTDVVTPSYPRIILKVLIYNRFESAQRCLKSLKDAFYDGSKVDIHIYIDHYTSGVKCDRNESESAFSDFHKLRGTSRTTSYSSCLETSHQILSFVNLFPWEHGSKYIHYRTSNIGLQGQWIEQWFPADNEFAYVVEDDIVVSKYFFRYIKSAIQYYYYSPNRRKNIFGICTQKQEFSVALNERASPMKLKVFNQNKPFLFGSVGSWGTVFFPEHWREFRLWFDRAKNVPGFTPLISGVKKSQLRTNEWYRLLGDKIWTPWFIYFMEKKKWYSVYINFPSRKFLSASWREVGTSYLKNEGLSSQLVEDERDLNYEFLPPESMLFLDVCVNSKNFKGLFKWDGIDKTVLEGQQFKFFLNNFSPYQGFVNVIYGTEDADMYPMALDYICNAEAIGISKMIFVTGSSGLASKLLERGIGVILITKMNPIFEFPEYDNSPTANELTFNGLEMVTDWSYKNPVIDFQHYVRRLHFKYALKGPSIMDKSIDYDKKMTKYLDIITYMILKHKYLVLMNDVKLRYSLNSIDILLREVSRAGAADIYFSPRIKNLYSPYNFGKELQEFRTDSRVFVVIKCSEEMVSAMKGLIFDYKDHDEDSVIETIRAITVEKLQLNEVAMKIVSKLRSATLRESIFTTITRKLKGYKTLIEPMVILPDLKCCYTTPEDYDSPSHDHLNTSMSKYYDVVSREGMEFIKMDQLVCSVIACYSEYKKYDTELVVKLILDAK